MARRSFKKALLWGAFLFSGLFAGLALADCPQLPGGEQVRVRHIYDGDTVQLSDGRRVRLLGINTPELGRDGRPDQAHAEAARQALLALIDDQPLRLVVGIQPKDHYGRLLGHLFSPDGRNLSEQLLRNGDGFWVAVEPNTRLADCLQRAEYEARQARLGVWGTPLAKAKPAAQLQPGDGGFMLLSGRVSRVQPGRRHWYIELDARLALRIDSALAERIGRARLQNLLNQPVQVRGWLIDRQADGRTLKPGWRRWLLTLTHPDHLKPL
ncbi:thermonuclease family protein [Marinobacterium arenosum]|uniref:thermonuclease family protein n=1 Tax=Marinobacterium arenosum TaxID=2862496 RepID=UPI001C94CC94|nr:thermonuclease family protein [Marinobacterium arenosum]MBY4678082.1 thermonuclease family protein [Marinobacterium arenosum]